MRAFVRFAASLLLIVLLTLSGLAQSSTTTGTITTYAGPQLPVNGAQATTQAIDFPHSVIPDGAGGFYVNSSKQNKIYRVVGDATLRVIAGSGAAGFSGDGGPATSAQLNQPKGIALDATGSLFIADASNNRIRKVTPDGLISTVAGNGTSGFGGDGGPAVAAKLNRPFGLAVDTAGNVFIADYDNYRIRKVTPGGVITTVAGTGEYGFSGDGGPATSAALGATGVAVDAAGNLFIADYDNYRIRKVTAAGIISTVAGTGTGGFSGDGGPAVAARLNDPFGVAVDTAGNLLIADYNNDRIRKVTPNGIITTVAGSGTNGFSGDGGPATSARLRGPSGVAVDAAGNLLIADYNNHRIRKVTADGTITTVAGTPIFYFSGDGGPATSATLSNPRGVAVDAAGNLFIADYDNYRIRKVTPDGVITTVAGNGTADFSGDGGPAASAALGAAGVAVDTAGNLLIADTDNNRIRMVTPAGTINTVAGAGRSGFSGDGGPATSATLSNPQGVAVDAAGNIFIADYHNCRIRKMTPDGIITTVAGTGRSGFSGDGGPAASAALCAAGVAVDTTGNLLIADMDNNRIRKVTPDGLISTVAGNGTSGFGGDGGPAVAARLNRPFGLAVDTAGNVFIADYDNYRIRKVTPGGIITTVAGAGEYGFSGDGGPATSAALGATDVAVDAAGNLFIADKDNSRIRKVTFIQQSTTFSMTDRGGVLFRSSGTSVSMTVGYARIQPDSGRTTPSGLAIFGFRQNKVLVSEAGVPASPLIQSGRIYAEVSADARLNTGIAVANPNSQDASITFQITNSEGAVVHSGNFTLQANKQRAAFLDADPFFGPKPVQGAMSFSSSVPISVIALRTFTNERAEFLMTTLPVINTALPAGTGTQYIPHFADGAGFTTHILLVNPTETTMSGTVQFFNQGSGSTTPGAATNVSIGGQVSSTHAYAVAARSSVGLSTAGTAASLTQGSVRVIPAGGGAGPVPLVVFSYRPAGITLSEAGVPAIQGSAFRMFAQSSGISGTPGNIQTGFAVANTSTSAGTVTLELTNLDGSTTGLPSPATRTLPGSGQIVGFLADFFPVNLPNPFRGVLRVSTTSSGISVVGIRSRYNEIGSYLMTTTPPTNEASASSSAELLFPHIVDGGGFTTEFILFSGTSGQSSSGNLRFFGDDGSALNLTLN